MYVSMSACISVMFSNKFGRKDELMLTSAKLHHGNRYIYYLVTKEHYWNNPTYAKYKKSRSIPKIGCGLYRLQWCKRKEIIINEWSKILK